MKPKFYLSNDTTSEDRANQECELNAVDPQRRNLLLGSVTALAAITLVSKSFAATLSGPASQEVSIENFSAAGKNEGTVRIAKVIKTDAEWRAMLSPDSYGVTRHAGTERAFTGKYNNNHADGIYRCICCDTALYDSRTKFESGTGWPSFWRPISEQNILKTSDFTLGERRVAISCRRCDAHLGHVFNDGPRPTGLRYCMNSVALNFVVRA